MEVVNNRLLYTPIKVSSWSRLENESPFYNSEQQTKFKFNGVPPLADNWQLCGEQTAPGAPCACADQHTWHPTLLFHIFHNGFKLVLKSVKSFLMLPQQKMQQIKKCNNSVKELSCYEVCPHPKTSLFIYGLLRCCTTEVGNPFLETEMTQSKTGHCQYETQPNKCKSDRNISGQQPL